MPSFGLTQNHPRRNVRLDTLVRLRWLAIIGQTTAVLLVFYGLEFPLPILACLAVIALAASLNVALRLRFHMTQRLEPDRAAFGQALDHRLHRARARLEPPEGQLQALRITLQRVPALDLWRPAAQGPEEIIHIVGAEAHCSQVQLEKPR